MDKWEDNKAWFLVVPVFIIVAFSSILPLMTVVNYSCVAGYLHPGQSVFVGIRVVQRDVGFTNACKRRLLRQFLFSGLVLLIEMLPGILPALAMPERGWGVSACLVHDFAPPSDPEYDRNDLDYLYAAGYRPWRGHQQIREFDHTARPPDARITVMLMEIWH